MSAPCSHVQVHQTLLTEVAFVGVESDRKAMNVTHGISRATATGNSGEAYKNMGLIGWRIQKRSSSYVRPISIGLTRRVLPRHEHVQHALVISHDLQAMSAHFYDGT
jgi:hypothetical protein